MDAPATLPFPSTDRAEVICEADVPYSVDGRPVVIRVLFEAASGEVPRLPFAPSVTFRVEVISQTCAAQPRAGA